MVKIEIEGPALLWYTSRLNFASTVYWGKQTRVKFGTGVHRTKGILDYVHSDVWGPARNVTLGGKRWFATFIDQGEFGCIQCGTRMRSLISFLIGRRWWRPKQAEKSRS